MSKIRAIFRKESRAYFNSPIAYLVITVLLIGVGYFFFQTFFMADQANLRTFFRLAAWSFVLFAPAITMKQFAEERKSGTIEVLLTLPVREHEVVLGKFFAAWLLLLVYCLITLVYPLTVGMVGDLDWGPVIGGYIGLLLVGAVYLALGIFASSITKNQVVALVLAFVVGLALFLVGLLLPFIPPSLQSLFEYAGMDSHFSNIARGVLDTRDLVYTLSLTAFLLFAAVQVIEGRMSDRSAPRRINKILYVLAALGSLICLNVLASQVFGRVDLTEDRRYALSDGSRELVSSLDDQLLVKAYFTGDLPAPFNNHARFLKDQLEEYRVASGGRIRYEFIDPARGRGEEGAPDLEAEARAAGIPKVEVQKLERDQMVAVKVYMGVALYYQDRQETIPMLRNISELEYELSSLIAKLVRDRTPVVGFSTGHGEASLREELQGVSMLLQKNYEVKEVDLGRGAEALDGVDILAVIGPSSTVQPWQRFLIDQFVMGGGKAVFLLDRNVVDFQTFFGRPQDDGLGELLAAYGAAPGKALVLDLVNQQIRLNSRQGNMMMSSLTPYPAMVRVKDMPQDDPLVKNLQNLTIPFAANLIVDPPEGVDARVLARSSEKSWLFENEDTFLADPQSLPEPMTDELNGPFDLAAVLEGNFTSFYKGKPAPAMEQGGEPVAESVIESSPPTRLAVVGSSYMIRDRLRNRLGVALLANLMDWMVQDENLINIRARGIVNRPLDKITDGARNAIKYGNMLGLPAAFALFGVIRWRVRTARKRRGLKNASAGSSRS